VRKRTDELAFEPCFPDVVGDFVEEIPRQNERKIRLSFDERFVGEDFDTRPGEEPSLLELRAVSGEREEASDAGVVEERVPLRRSRDGGDGHARPRRPHTERQELVHLVAEHLRDRFQVVDRPILALEHRVDFRAHFTLSLSSDVDPEHASVERTLFDIEDFHAVPFHESDDRLEREVREVLVVHGVHLHAFQELPEVGRLEDEDAFRF